MVDDDDDLLGHLSQLKENGHMLLNDMLCFIALCPGGICLAELKLIGAQMLKNLSPPQLEYQTTDMKTYEEIIKEISCVKSIICAEDDEDNYDEEQQ